MGNLVYLALAVGLSTVGMIVLWVIRHRPRSMQARMDAFHREMAALAPPQAKAHRSEIHLDNVAPTPVRPRIAGNGGAARAERNGPVRARRGGSSPQGDRRRSRD